MKLHRKTHLQILLSALVLAAVPAHAATVSLDFEGSSSGSSTTPAGWSLVTVDASPAYLTTTGVGGSGLGGQITANHDSNSPTVPGGYVVNDGGIPLDLTQPINGSFDFYIPENGNYSGALFMLGDIADGIDENNSNEYLAMHLRERTFGARAQIVDGDGNSLDTDSSYRIESNTWYEADFTWTPTSGTTGDFSYTVPYSTSNTWTASTTGFTFDSNEAFFGFGSGGYFGNDHQGRFDNILIEGTAVVIPEPTHALFLCIGAVTMMLRRRRG